MVAGHLARAALELTDRKAAAARGFVELPLGAAPAETGVAGAGFEQGHLLVAPGLVGAHGGAALLASGLLGVGARGAGCGGVGGEVGGGLGLGRGGGEQRDGAEGSRGKQVFHSEEGGRRVRGKTVGRATACAGQWFRPGRGRVGQRGG